MSHGKPDGGPVTRHGFTMRLKPGVADEYRRRHDAIWPELVEALKRAGVSEYSIFLDEKTGVLFAVQSRSMDNTVSELPGLAIMRKWWDYMADLMEVEADRSPVCGALTEVFYMP